MPHPFTAVVVAALMALFIQPVSAQNWPDWRGPNHDGTATATGTIQNDDLYRTAFLVAATAARLMEGNANFTPFEFAVTRSGTVNTTHSVRWAVAGLGSFSADAKDFIGDKLPFGTLTFSPGESLKKITVLVRGDLVVEQDESFLVKVSNLIGSGGGIVVDVVGGLIRNDDRART
jgi:hypothetical protein